MFLVTKIVVVVGLKLLNVYIMMRTLSSPSITRKTEKGLPQYRDAEESDVFLLSGQEDLVPVLVRGGDGCWRSDECELDGYQIKQYRPRIEGLFARIERWTRTEDGDTHWRSISKDKVLPRS